MYIVWHFYLPILYTWNNIDVRLTIFYTAKFFYFENLRHNLTLV